MRVPSTLRAVLRQVRDCLGRLQMFNLDNSGTQMMDDQPDTTNDQQRGQEEERRLNPIRLKKRVRQRVGNWCLQIECAHRSTTQNCSTFRLRLLKYTKPVRSLGVPRSVYVYIASTATFATIRDKIDVMVEYMKFCRRALEMVDRIDVSVLSIVDKSYYRYTRLELINTDEDYLSVNLVFDNPTLDHTTIPILNARLLLKTQSDLIFDDLLAIRSLYEQQHSESILARLQKTTLFIASSDDFNDYLQKLTSLLRLDAELTVEDVDVRCLGIVLMYLLPMLIIGTIQPLLYYLDVLDTLELATSTDDVDLLDDTLDALGMFNIDE